MRCLLHISAHGSLIGTIPFVYSMKYSICESACVNSLQSSICEFAVSMLQMLVHVRLYLNVSTCQECKIILCCFSTYDTLYSDACTKQQGSCSYTYKEHHITFWAIINLFFGLSHSPCSLGTAVWVPP